jgi:hypothetical protein
MDKNLEKTILGTQTLQAFFDQFGDDVYAEELLSILVEELLKNDDKIIRIPSSQK